MPQKCRGWVNLPVTLPGKFVSVGFNYKDYTEGTGIKIPSEPILLLKMYLRHYTERCQ
jgi:hypothetical protein